jgi:DNA-directed RNA polymerase specialized sigma24 family protein
MARDAQIEARLLRWAAWLTVGDGSGFPVMSVIHPEWQPPSPGVTPTLKVGASTDVRQTHRAIAKLSLRLRNTLIVHYVHRSPLADQAALLGCEVSTVIARVASAHRPLAKEFCNKLEVG